MYRTAKLLTTFGIVLGLLSGAAVAHEGHAKAKEGQAVTLTGELIDTACFVAGDAKGAEHADCARKCMASGVPAAILPEGSKDGDAMVFLLTNPVVLAPYAAKTIKVEGESYPARHAIDVKKLMVKDGEHWKEVALKDEHHKSSETSADHAQHEHK